LTRAILRLFGFIALLTLVASSPAAAAPVLSPADAQIYRAAFDMVRAGNWSEARRLAAGARILSSPK